MGTALFCHGCGATVAIPAGFTRNKLLCPECGVMIAVTAPAPAPAAVDPARKRSAGAGTAPAARSCPACGQPLPAGVRDCAECAAAAALSVSDTRPKEPGQTPPPARPAADAVTTAPTLPAAKPTWDEDEEDGLPYVVGDQQRICPACSRPLGADNLVCPRCDFDLVRKRQAIRVWPTVQRQWNTGIATEARWTLLIVTEGLFLVGILVGIATTGDVCAFLVPGLVFAMGISFVLGTWYRIDVMRNAKGRVRLTRTLVVCFVARPPHTFRLGDFEGVLSGKENNGKWMEWLFLIFFVPTCVGMVLWWYYAIYKEVFQVSLTRDHGYPDEIIYQGWSEPMMREVEKLMRELLRC